MKNKVYLVGAGPGKPDLITVRGLNILKEADVVIYDYLVDKRILENAKEGADLICCDKLAKKGRYSNGFSKHQERISNLIVKKAKEGKRVARLKNGDVSIFSRLSQELDALVRNKIDYELVPGVTAASGAASYAGIPLTDREFASTCAFVTGHEDPNKEVSSIDWKALSKVGTVVFYMAVENLPEIVKELIKVGKPKDTGCAIVQNATLATQKVLSANLEDIAKRAKREGIKPPAIIVVGDVVKLGKRFNWLKKNKKIIFTGLSEERFFIKGVYFHLPLIKIEPMDDYRGFDNYLKNISDYDWLIFASRYGVEYFFKRLEAVGLDSRVLNGIKIAAVGDSTKNRLLDFGIKADLVPRNESSKGLIERFKKENFKGKNIFLPRSDISDKGLEKELGKLGALVTTSVAYRNVMPKDLPDLDLNDFDKIMFTSPSTVRNFKKRYKKVPKKVKIRYIGDVTLREIKRCRLRV
ncbi:MAG: uroporphyrinogen-III C-methyltransferase [Candidatus Omnitrophota bacterium]|nr:uroporphyrinogen-III C-methyltransferase [Candidatus Omnitrophota bacterium]